MRRNFLLSGITALSLILMISGCQTSGGHRRAPTETREANGFSITESESVGFRVRLSFDEANQAIQDGDLDRGIKLLTEVTDSAPDFAAANINLGIAHQRNGNLPHAETALLRALEANPRHPLAHNELGIVHRRTGRFEEARKSYEAALDLQPTFHFARMNLAVLCDLYLADLACALENYRLYQDADPAHEATGIWIADVEGRIGKKGD
jgi:tetratricopeptide (TPR) repeat protein